MAESLIIPSGTKSEKYEQIFPQLKALLEVETDTIANMANLCAALKYGMGFFWIGFYLVKKDELVLGPFQGPVACTRIKPGKGVCGKSLELKETIIVDDVDQFPGHIACSSDSKSEIVIPFFDENKNVVGVLDIDSDSYSSFDEIDEAWLKKIISLIKGINP